MRTRNRKRVGTHRSGGRPNGDAAATTRIRSLKQADTRRNGGLLAEDALTDKQAIANFPFGVSEALVRRSP